tara:strand:+ start:1400 stop:2350 length:951 start_codon:yes stop_codon:yes gene_type:complete
MDKSADDLIEKLLKSSKHELKLGSNDNFNYARIPFSIPALDKLTGGGIPKKRLTLIYGPTNVGKSYLASQIVANSQRDGGLTAWVDTELSWDANWYEKCGVDTSKIMVSQPSNGEEAFEVVKELMVAGVDVIVLDSIAGLVPATVADEGFDYNPIAWQARFINSSLPKLLPNLKYGSALVAINQVRSSMGPVALDAMPGGLAQQFFAHSLLQVKRKGWIKDDKDKDQNVGFDMEVRLRKTKVGGENWKSAIVPFRVDGGIDIVESYIREALEQGVIERSGAWYTYKGSKTMGLQGVKNVFAEDEKLFEELKNELTP